MVNQFPWLAQIHFDGSAVLDVILVFLVIYQILIWVKSTQSVNLIRGLLVILSIIICARVFDFNTLNWLLEKLATILILFFIIVFQPELRRILDLMGRGRLFGARFSKDIQEAAIIKHLLKSVDTLSKEKIGALIVIQLTTNLREYVESGIQIDGSVSFELLTNLFWPNTPTHDGAVIIKGNQVLAAGCLLPLTDSRIVDRRLGTRHRAAIGLTEISDAIVIVISEETGVISMAEVGNLTRFLNREALETRLFNLYSDKEEEYVSPKRWLSNMFKKKEG
ncbi:MAG: TIGR00159 family protein [Candidatus Margulisbacteria bacterium]|nr:TIGR00159 family protein [Candidatus Margulisiibacteriota bacterium]